MKRKTKVLLALPLLIMAYDLILHTIEFFNIGGDFIVIFYSVATTPIRMVGYSSFWFGIWTLAVCLYVAGLLSMQGERK